MGASEVAAVVGAGVITGLGLYVATGGFTKGLVLKNVAGYDNEQAEIRRVTVNTRSDGIHVYA